MKAPANNRNTFVDGLRGIAASIVILPHASGIFKSYQGTQIDQLVHTIAVPMSHGVDIFFVISGYAICSSLSNSRMNLKNIGIFLLSRSIRLDPMYWLSLTLTLACLLLQKKHTNTPFNGGVILERLLIHILYLQDILKTEAFSVTYWTLCVEIQFYVIYSLILSVQDYSKYFKQSLSVVFFASLLAVLYHLDTPRIFLPFLFQFLIGVFAYHTARLKMPFWVFISFLIVPFLFSNSSDFFLRCVVTGSTGLMIYLSSTKLSLARSLDHPVFQFLGQHSYGIYLFHTVVFFLLLAVKARIQIDTIWTRMAWLITGYALTLFLARIAHEFIEKPCLNFSRTLKTSLSVR